MRPAAATSSCSTACAIVGGTLTSTGTSNLSATGSSNMSAVTLSNGSLLNITAYGSQLTVTNGITNNGTIVVDSDTFGWNEYLIFSGSQTLSGTGSVSLNAGYLNTVNFGDVLTQAAGHTISGYGQINAALNNQGLVNANVNGQTLSLATNPMTNAATMEATNGGVLSISTTVNNAGGTILASGGGNVQLFNGSAIVGGTLTSTGTSNLSATGSSNMSAVTLSNGSLLNITAYGSQLTVTNGITNNGTIVVDSDTFGWNEYLIFSGSQTLSGTGSVSLNAGYLNTVNFGDVLTQAAGHTISGYGQINAALNNQGLVNANVNGQTLSLATNPMTNAATMEATNGGVLSISTTVNNAGGTILASGGGNVQLFNGSAIVGGTLTSTGTSNLSATGSSNMSAVTLSNGSLLNITAYGSQLTVTNGITNNGTIVVDSDSFWMERV